MPAINTTTPNTDTQTKTHLMDPLRRGVKAFLLVAVVVAFGLPVATADTPGGAPMMCPVTPDEEIDPKISLEHDGQTIYFCCQSCRRKFETSPKRYAFAVTAAGAISDSVPVTMGSSTDASHEHEHDHASDHGTAESGVLTPLGKFHPMVVHFPIALLIAAAVARCLMLMGSFSWAGPAVRFCVLLGGVSAVVAASLGWINAGWPGDNESIGVVLFNHRWLGVGTAVWGIVLITMVEMETRKPSEALNPLTTLALLVGAGLVGLTGHFGGIMVFGPDYLPW